VQRAGQAVRWLHLQKIIRQAKRKADGKADDATQAAAGNGFRKVYSS